MDQVPEQQSCQRIQSKTQNHCILLQPCLLSLSFEFSRWKKAFPTHRPTRTKQQKNCMQIFRLYLPQFFLFDRNYYYYSKRIEKIPTIKIKMKKRWLVCQKLWNLNIWKNDHHHCLSPSSSSLSLFLCYIVIYHRRKKMLTTIMNDILPRKTLNSIIMVQKEKFHAFFLLNEIILFIHSFD